MTVYVATFRATRRTASERRGLVRCTSQSHVFTLQSLTKFKLNKSSILDQRQKIARTVHALRRAWVAGTVRGRENGSRFASIHHWVDSRLNLLRYLRSLFIKVHTALGWARSWTAAQRRALAGREELTWSLCVSLLGRKARWVSPVVSARRIFECLLLKSCSSDRQPVRPASFGFARLARPRKEHRLILARKLQAKFEKKHATLPESILAGGCRSTEERLVAGAVIALIMRWTSSYIREISYRHCNSCGDPGI